MAILNVRFECAGLIVGCADWVCGGAFKEFADRLAAFIDGRLDACRLEGTSNELVCEFERVTVGTRKAVYFSIQFQSVLPFDDYLLKSGRPRGTTVSSHGIKCVEDLSPLFRVMEEISWALK